MAYPFIAAHSNNYLKGRQGQKIKYIVIHSIVGSAASAIATFKKPDRIASAHYIVAWNGSITQMVKDSDAAYHAGNFTINLQSIGIEHDDQAKPNVVRPPALYKTSAKLVYDLCKKYKIPIDRKYIRMHREISATACPAKLDVERIVREAKALDKEVVDVYTEVPKKYSDGKPRNAFNWYRAFAIEYERKVAANKIVTQQVNQLKTFSGQITGFQNAIKEDVKAIKSLQDSKAKNEKEIQALTAKVNALSEASGGLTGYTIGELLRA